MKRLEVRINNDNYERIKRAAKADNVAISSWIVQQAILNAMRHHTAKLPVEPIPAADEPLPPVTEVEQAVLSMLPDPPEDNIFVDLESRLARAARSTWPGHIEIMNKNYPGFADWMAKRMK